MALFTPDPDMDSCDCVTHVEEANSKLQEMVEKWKRLKILKDDLQDALEKSDTELQEMTQELASLREENKSLQKEKVKFLDLMEEADRLKLSLEQSKNAECTAKRDRKELERRSLQMEEKADQLLHQLSVSEEEKQLLSDNVTRLRQEVMELQRHLDAKTLELNEKDNQAQERESIIEEMRMTMNQYFSIKEVLNDKIQELQSQLEESYQEIAMRKAFEENNLIANSEESGTIMYEMIQTRMEKQLEQAHMQKQRQGIQGFIGLRLLLNMVIQFILCSFSVGVFLLLVIFFMQLYHAVHPEHPLLDLRRVFSAKTIEVIQNILQPYVKQRGLEMMPS